MMLSLIDRLQLVAKDFPESTALVDAERSINYRTLWQQVDAVARALRFHNMEAGDRIAVIATKRIHSVYVLLGAMHAQLIVVPINPLLKPSQIEHILNDCGARMLFLPQQALTSLQEHIACAASLQHTVLTDSEAQARGVAARVSSATPTHTCEAVGYQKNENTALDWQRFLTAKGRSEDKDKDKDKDAHFTATILYTSGSTGNPKGVILTHSNLAYGAASISQYLNNTRNDRILAMMPLSFDYGLSQLTSALHTGACTVLYDYFLPKGLLDAVTRYKITGLPAVPHVWDQLANLTWPAVPHLRYLTNTGGRMNETTSRKLTSKLPDAALFLMYGFTEAFRSTYLPPDQVAIRPRSIGKTVPHATVLVVDEHGVEVPPDTVGELIHSGPLVTAGYWNDPALTQTIFRHRYANSCDDKGERFAWSGDLCTRDEEGFLYFVSRRDDQVKLRGYRVNPLEIEETIARCPQVVEVCVVCVPHAQVDTAAIAVIVSETPGITEIVDAYCRTHLPGYMVPHTIIQRDALPASPNNKIDRRQLMQTYHSYFTLQSSELTGL